MNRVFVLFAILLSLQFVGRASSQEFSSNPFPFTGAWGINGCKSHVIEFKKGKFYECGANNDKCYENPAEYRVKGGQIYVVVHAGIKGQTYDIHQIYTFTRSGIDTVSRRVLTEKGWGRKYVNDNVGLVPSYKCKKGFLGFGWKPDR